MTGLPVLGIIEERGKVEYPELKTIDCNETDDREGDGQDIQDNTSYRLTFYAKAKTRNAGSAITPTLYTDMPT